MYSNFLNTTKVLLLISGGLDSTACLEYYRNRSNTSVEALFVDYGQPAVNEENLATQAVCEHYKVSLKKICISTGINFSAGIIQGRNAMLLNMALMLFEQNAGLISIGIHAGTDYADCSKNFVNKMQNIFDIYTNGKIFIDTPFYSSSKLDIWDFCKQRKVPIHLTYSCETGGANVCGKCLSCRDREVLNATI